MDGAAWIEGYSEQAVAGAVRTALPELAADLVLHESIVQSNPFWHGGTAWLGDRHVVKFAWSAEAAAQLARERRAMLALQRTGFARWMPPIEAAPERPLLIVTRRVEGVPCWGDMLADGAALAGDVAQALADLHEPAVAAALWEAGLDLPAPAPQADTDAIRARLGRFLDPVHVPLVHRWCDWTDAVQSRATGDHVVLHGDLHGFNLLVDGGRVVCVLDYDGISAGDHHFDFRYLPGIEATIGFLVRTVEAYEARSGRTVHPAPLLAWHIRTVLGDALWRSEAGVELPGGGTVRDWVVLLEARIGALAAWRPFERP